MADLFKSSNLSIEQHTDRLRSFTLSIPEHINWSFLPSQYIDVAFLDHSNKFSGYSLTSTAQDKIISISVQKTLEYTTSHKLFELRVGDEIIVRGPAGDFTLNCDKIHYIVLIAGGIGVTPIISMFRTATKHSLVKQVKFFHSAKTVPELLFQNEFQQTSKINLQIEYFYSVTNQPDSTVRYGRFSVQNVITTIDEKLLNYFHFFICGPGSMNTDFQQGLLNQGIINDHIHIESYYEP